MLLQKGRSRSILEIAEAQKIGASFFSWLLRLKKLAPHIQEAILDKRQPRTMQWEELTRVMPGE